MLRLDLIAGPNGAGKATFARTVVLPTLANPRFVNADEIAAVRWPGKEEGHAYQTSALAGEVGSQLIARRLPFVAETVFSHPSKVELVLEAKRAGYTVVLHVIVVPKALSLARVSQRVAEGGHAVPPEKISSRYDRLWPLVSSAMALADQATVYDASVEGSPRIVAHLYDGLVVGAVDWPGGRRRRSPSAGTPERDPPRVAAQRAAWDVSLQILQGSHVTSGR